MYTEIPSLLKLPPTHPHPNHTPHRRARAEIPVLHSNFSMPSYFTHGSIYMLTLDSVHMH